MAFVVTLIGFMPPPRADGTAWSRVHVEEAPASSGPWAQIDDLALDPLDANPRLPMSRDITTALATLEQGWYRVVFFDPFGSQSDYSDPVPNPETVDLPPSPSAIRNVSPLLRSKFPIPPTDPYANADLRNLVAQATAMVQTVTWRLIDPTLGDLSPEGETSAVVPDGMVPIAVQAVARMAERIRVTTDPAFAEQVATGRRLRGFSAGPYSESYFAPGEFARRGAVQSRPTVDPDDALDSTLWALMTEDARDYFVWRATGMAPPTGIATGFDYRRLSIGYGAGAPGFPYDGYGRGGPDGF